ncbi:glycosyltransferase family 4 protein [Halobacterium bonnevillei]|uniref:Glycosyltransferase n=1 Tax=Halobacterium bonnevillei TaxID=2692200 RepID=A0A6B0SKR2_9EURY|nr:glycosyltransferase family 4 protein [Halobacterium bonnevillei]MXR19470.1 glycosyltransferase [Halobacterium bonnevillei]
MRVLHATGTFLPVKGGCPYFIHHLTRHLEQCGDTCRVVTTDQGGDVTADTVATDRSGSRKVAGFPVSPGYPLTLRRAIADFEPDIVHTHYPLPFFPETAALCAELADVPLVLTCHGAFEMNWTSLIGAFGSIYNRSLLHASLRAADRIHVSNDAIPGEFGLFDRYKSKLTTVPMGVDTAWYDPDAVDGDPPYPIDSGTMVVLFVGTFRRYKGLDTLIAAFDQIEGIDSRLVLVGDGPLREDVKEAVTERGLGGRVTITGHLNDETLRRAYAGADAFVLPSPTMSESFGLVALEAMAMGLPTLVTSESGVGRVLAQETAGIVVEPNAPETLAREIESILTNKQRYQGQVKAGKTLVADRFAWKSIVECYRTLYREVA